MAFMKEIIQQFYGLEVISVRPFGDGHINQTFQVQTKVGDYIFQQINAAIFKNPACIDQNIRTAAAHLAKVAPDYLFVSPLAALTGDTMLVVDNAYWRLMPFVSNSKSINRVTVPAEAYQAAKAFGLLTKNLNGLALDALQETIPRFHDLSFRKSEFEQARQNASNDRIQTAEMCISWAEEHTNLVDIFDEIRVNPSIPRRLLHHDTKINNVLFQQDSTEVLAVCDLDTLMPGIVISDVGDMVRTYTCSDTEESTNFSDLHIIDDLYIALYDGFLSEMASVLTPDEREILYYAGLFMFYMQGLRFLTDYLNGNVYYPVKYETHNLDRATNQFILLQQLVGKKEIYERQIEELTKKWLST